MRKTAIAGLVAALVLQAFALADAQAKSSRIEGTIVSVAGSSIKVKTASGIQTALLDPHVRVLDVTKSSLDRVTDGAFIGTTVIPQPDGTYRSTEVHVFAPALRGMGEGFTKMNPGGTRMMANSTVRPVNMMANSTIKSVRSDAGGRTISMTFAAGGKKIIRIPANVPVSYLAPASKALLAKGATALLICNGSPGHFVAKTIVISHR